MKIFWAESARYSRRKLIEFIAIDNVAAAIELDDLITFTANRLTEFPLLGKVGRIVGTRELVLHKHYVLIYEVAEGIVFILNILHTSQQWPPTAG